jgi:hypothetical protein
MYDGDQRSILIGWLRYLVLTAVLMMAPWLLTIFNCGADDGTVVAHHLKHRHTPWSGGGMAMKAHDWLTMALCYVCHDKAHNGDHDILDNQFLLIWKTQNQAFKEGRLQYVSD